MSYCKHNIGYDECADCRCEHGVLFCDPCIDCDIAADVAAHACALDRLLMEVAA